MKRSTERILTTHTGSLPRPLDLVPLLVAKDVGELQDIPAFQRRVAAAVREVVAHQSEIGIALLNDGEQGKIGYSTYVKDRLSGFAGEETVRPVRVEARDFPEWAARQQTGLTARRPTCNGPIGWKNFTEVQIDIDNLKAATRGVNAEEVFMSAASPGVIAHFLGDHYYGSEEKFVYALADAMKREYDAIYQAGFILQIDCPDLAMSKNTRFPDMSTQEFRKVAQLHVEALNHATRDIPPESMRLHMCWGNGEGPHNRDIELKDILDVVLKARPNAISFVAANPRHEHEWKVFRDVKLPPGKVIIPGVLDSTTNFVEHPELVAERLVRYAGVVGRENVIAGTDCGFGTFARTEPNVDQKISWAKLQAMVEGAEIASKELWARSRRPAAASRPKAAPSKTRAAAAKPRSTTKTPKTAPSARRKTAAPRRTTAAGARRMTEAPRRTTPADARRKTAATRRATPAGARRKTAATRRATAVRVRRVR